LKQTKRQSVCQDM